MNKKNGISVVIVTLICLLWPGRLVLAQSVGGTLMEPVDTVCYKANHGVLRLSGEIGNVLYWEYSTSGSSPWTTINNTLDSLKYNDLSQTTWFRAVVKYGVNPPDTSSSAKIVVSPLSAGGQIAGAQAVCQEANSGTLSLTGFTGKIKDWEYSADGGNSWITLGTDQKDYTFGNLSVTNYYHVIVKSGACPADTSTPAVVPVSPATVAGILSFSDTVCAGSNQGEIVLSGFTGDIVRWESSENGMKPWSTIHYTNDTLSYDNLLRTYYYRAVVQSGACREKITGPSAVIVSPSSEGGFVTGSADVCAETNDGTLVLSGYRGDIEKWQYSRDFGSTWQDTSNINHTLNYSRLKKTMLFRVMVKSGACTATTSEYASVTVNPLPDVGFVAAPVCRTHATLFHNVSTIEKGSLISYSWDFGNGDGNNSMDPVYTYPAEGTYTVKLTATSAKGCNKDTSLVVRVNSVPRVNFSFENRCDGTAIDFTNNSFSTEGGTISFLWNFNDSSAMQTSRNPSHVFPGQGTYAVKLKVTTTATGCSDSIIQPVKVYPNPVPVFEFSNACLGQSINFVNKSSLLEGALQYYWTFGDGKTSGEINTSHNYNTDGNYKVILTAISDHNCSDTVSANVSVYPLPATDFYAEDICYFDTARFQNRSTIKSDIMFFQWNFGNGMTSTAENPIYYYTAPGKYSVSLKVASDKGCIGEAFDELTVFALPKVDFNADDVCGYDPVIFRNTSVTQNESLSFRWDFGDGRGTTIASPEHKYAVPGTYQAHLIAASGGCNDSVSKTVNVFPTPEPGFSAENICDGNPSSFFDTSKIQSGNINSFVWDFGDGSGAVQQNPVHQYLNPGVYEVSLAVTSNRGCKTSLTRSLSVDYLPLASFSVNNVCLGFPVEPVNQSFIERGNISYNWNFGDDYSSNIPGPSHLYSNPGIFPVLLKVRSDNGCIDSLIRFVQVYSLPDANAGTDVNISKGEEIRLNASGGIAYSWYPSDFLSDPQSANPVAAPPESLDYVMEVKDLHSCTASDTMRVNVHDDYRITPGRLLTPDANGINDTWVIDNIDSYDDCNVSVYDRWGNEVFSTDHYQNNWAGTNRNGDILPDGTYYYLVRFKNSDKVYKGAVSLLRNK